MQCPYCGAENADSAQFCNLCMRRFDEVAAGQTRMDAAPAPEPATPAPAPEAVAPAPSEQATLEYGAGAPAWEQPAAAPIETPAPEPAAPAPAWLPDDQGASATAQADGWGTPASGAAMPSDDWGTPGPSFAAQDAVGVPSTSADDADFADPLLGITAESIEEADLEANRLKRIMDHGSAEAAAAAADMEVSEALETQRRHAHARRLAIWVPLGIVLTALAAAVAYYFGRWVVAGDTIRVSAGSSMVKLLLQGAVWAIALGAASFAAGYAAGRGANRRAWGRIAVLAVVVVAAAQLGPMAATMGAPDPLQRVVAIVSAAGIAAATLIGLGGASVGGRER